MGSIALAILRPSLTYPLRIPIELGLIERDTDWLMPMGLPERGEVPRAPIGLPKPSRVEGVSDTVELREEMREEMRVPVPTESTRWHGLVGTCVSKRLVLIDGSLSYASFFVADLPSLTFAANLHLASSRRDVSYC